MIVEKNNSTALSIKYSDKTGLRFNNIVNDADSEAIFMSATTINSLQTDKDITEIKRIYKYDIVEEGN